MKPLSVVWWQLNQLLFLYRNIFLFWWLPPTPLFFFFFGKLFSGASFSRKGTCSWKHKTQNRCDLLSIFPSSYFLIIIFFPGCCMVPLSWHSGCLECCWLGRQLLICLQLSLQVGSAGEEVGLGMKTWKLFQEMNLIGFMKSGMKACKSGWWTWMCKSLSFSLISSQRL